MYQEVYLLAAGHTARHALNIYLGSLEKETSFNNGTDVC